MASGAITSIAIKKESSFKTDPTGTYSGIFGYGTKVTSIEKNNNIQRIYGLGSRNAQILLPMQFAGSLGIEYLLSNPWNFVSTLGKVATTGPDVNGIYTHTFTEQDTIPSYAIKNNIELGTTDAQQILLGCINANKTIACSLGEPVVISDDFLYTDEVFSTTSYVSQIAETFAPFTFAHGSFSLPDGTTIGKVQTCEASIANSADIIYGLGSRIGSTHLEKQREYGIRSSIYLTDPAIFWRAFYAGGTTSPFSGTTPGTITETPTLSLTFDNGLTLGNQRQIKLTFTGVMLDTYSTSYDVTAPIIEDGSFIARSLTITALNTTSSTPTDWY